MANVKTTQVAVKSASTKSLNGAAPHAGQKIHSDPTSFERAHARFTQAQDDFMAFLGAPGWKRTVIALLSGLVVACGLGYLVGTIVGYLMVGAILATNSMFITLVLGVMASIWLGMKTWSVASRITGSILTGEADEKAIAAYDATRNTLARLNPMRLFGAKPVAA